MLRLAPFLLFFLLAVPALAEPLPPEPISDDPYSVSGVEVDVKGSSGVDARDKAFTEGGRTALKTLATRLSGVKVPDLASIDDNSISRLIKSFEVQKEKASGSRYIGTLTFHFKPEVTDAFLESRGMGIQASDGPTGIGAPPAYAEAPTMRMVILPIMKLKDRSILWEEKTSWAQAWENYLSDNPDPNFVVPEGTMEDIGLVSTTEALSGVPGPLTKIIRQHEARGALVVVLVADSPAPEPNKPLSVQLASFDSRGALRNTSSFTLPAQPRRKAMEWLQDGAAFAAGYVRQQSDKILAGLPGLMPEATQAVARPFGFLQLHISVPFSSVQQWQRYRTSLQEIDHMMRLDIKSLTHSQAMIEVTYRGMRSSLDAALAEKGLRLEEINPDRLILVPSVIITAPPAPPPPLDNDEVMEDDEEEEEATPPVTAPPKPISPPGPPVDKPSRIR